MTLSLLILGQLASPTTENFGEALRKKQWKSAVEIADKLISLKTGDPMTKSKRFYALAMLDEKRALDDARKQEVSLQNDWLTLNNIAALMVSPDSFFKAPDYKLALRFAERAHKIVRPLKKYVTLDTLAMAKFRNGDKAAAVALIREEIKFFKSLGVPKGHPVYEECDERIAWFSKQPIAKRN